MSGRDGDEKGLGDRKGLGLASRFRAALDQKAAAQKRREEDRARREERARAARAALLQDLEAFGHALGHARVDTGDGWLCITLDGRELRFEAREEPGEVAVSGPGLRDGWRLRLQPELQRWGLYPPHGAVRPLFDKGLEELLRRVFELRPVDPDALVQSDQVTGGDERSPGAPFDRKRSL